MGITKPTSRWGFGAVSLWRVSGNWSPYTPRYAIVRQFLKFLLVVNWEEIPPEGKALEDEIAQAFEKYREIVSFKSMGSNGCC